MKIRRPLNWGISARLVLIATVPASLMFFVVSLALYFSSRDEVQRTIIERGSLIASTLAETSQYGLVSGNVSILERNVRQLLKTDESIAGIQILDADRKVIVSTQNSTVDAVSTFERAIGAEVPDINLYTRSDAPHVALPIERSTPFRAGQVDGFVRVSMSAAPIFKEKRERLYTAWVAVLITTLVSNVAGLVFAQRLRGPLTAVMSALRRIHTGNFEVDLERRASGEMGELQELIIEVASALSVKRQETEELVERRTHDLRQAVSVASNAVAEKRRLLARTNLMLEEERRRIALEIHDDLNASLVVLRMRAEHLQALASQGDEAGTSSEISTTAESISTSASRLYATARDIVKRLRPEVIDTLGLAGAVEEMVRQYDQLHPGCAFHLSVSEDFPNLRGQLAITCFRVVQEALSNVVKHAKARSAAVEMRRVADQPLLQLRISDDGLGFDPQTAGKDSLGLVGMRERIATVEGSIEIASASGTGTTITIVVPYLAGNAVGQE